MRMTSRLTDHPAAAVNRDDPVQRCDADHSVAGGANPVLLKT
jgi:hypothetical protein